MVDKIEKLKQILSDLAKQDGVDGVLVVSRGGLVIASSLTRDIHEETFAAMSATMVGASTAALAEYNKPAPDVFYVTGGGYGLIAIAAGERGLLVAMISDINKMQGIATQMGELKEDVAELVK